MADYDLVVPSDYMVRILVQLKLVRPLEKSRLKNLGNLDSRFLDKNFDRRLEDAIAHRTKFMNELAKTEEPLVERHFRHMCERLKIPFKTKPAGAYKGRE